MDALFQTHPDIVEVLCQKAQLLLGTLLDGLVWRSKRTMNSARRVNFYVKHLVAPLMKPFDIFCGVGRAFVLVLVLVLVLV